MSGKSQFDQAFDTVLSDISLGDTGAYLGLDKEYEQSYLVRSRNRFKTAFNGIPAAGHVLSVLDIGTTPFTFMIKKAFPHYDVATLDLTDLMAQRAEANGILFKKHNISQGTLPFNDNYFDVVVFTEMLEHLLIPPSVILREIHRILKDGGVLVFSTPNLASIDARLKFLFGASPQPPLEKVVDEKENWVHGYGHVRLYTMRECLNLLKRNDFSIKSSRYIQPHHHLNKIDKMVIPRLLYYVACSLYPPFGDTVYIECAANK